MAEDHERLSTNALNAKLDELEKRRQKERHEANSRIMGAILKQGEESIRAADRIDKMELTMGNVAVEVKDLRESMSPFVELARDLKFRLLGDPSMQTTGLVKDHEQLKLDIQTELLEIKKKGYQTFKEQRVAIWGAATTFITTVGLIIVAYIQLKK